MKYTKAMRTADFYKTFENLGFTYSEIETLRRAQMTLHRWAERECGDGSNYHLERDEATGKTFNVHSMSGKRYRTPDLETGAVKRVVEVIGARNSRTWVMSGETGEYNSKRGNKATDVKFYHQTDPRGCALYIIRPGDVPAGENVNAYYNRGIAVCIG